MRADEIRISPASSCQATRAGEWRSCTVGNTVEQPGDPVDEDSDDLPTGVDEDALDQDDLDTDQVASTEE